MDQKAQAQGRTQDTFNLGDGVQAEFLYLSGGITTSDEGCPGWGSNDLSQCLFIGEETGTVKLEYAGGITDEIPLIPGYTLWFKKTWPSPLEPFRSNRAAEELLRQTLHLSGGFEGSYPYLLRIKLRDLPLMNICIPSTDNKTGQCISEGIRFGHVTKGMETAEKLSSDFRIVDLGGFFPGHTVDSAEPFTAEIRRNLKEIKYWLETYEEDIQSFGKISAPESYSGLGLDLEGAPEGRILSSAYYHNIHDLRGKVDEQGFFHTSSAKAPTWYYNGFGPWLENVGSYYGSAFSRDCARGIMTLAQAGYAKDMGKVLERFHEWLMFFPRNYPKLQLDGKPIPGHWTVVPNMPLIYSEELVHVGWPTRYTAERFGLHHQDFGNPENDGHGLLMMANWKVWQKNGKPVQWVKESWEYLREAAEYILWSLDNSSLSLSEEGLLYSESEAGMNEITLYANIPCYIGLCMYSEMAAAAGKAEEAARWADYAGRMEKAVEQYFTVEDAEYGDVWNSEKIGFHRHDIVLAFFSDYLGKDLEEKLPEGWFERSRRTFEKDMAGRARLFGPKGLSYDHSMMTQGALLLDMMERAGILLDNLARVSYAPRLPWPFIMPECFIADTEHGVYHRRGDAGNLVQQADGLKCILLLAGVDDSQAEHLRVIPRVPRKYGGIKLKGCPVRVCVEGEVLQDKVDLEIHYPDEHSQNLLIKPEKHAIPQLSVRMGPFPQETGRLTCILVKDGISTEQELVCKQAGDSKWAWVHLENLEGEATISARVY